MGSESSAYSPARTDERARVVEVEGMHNFRDIGGYPVAGGGTTRWGVLFRGGTVHGMTHATRTRLRVGDLHGD